MVTKHWKVVSQISFCHIERRKRGKGKGYFQLSRQTNQQKMKTDFQNMMFCFWDLQKYWEFWKYYDGIILNFELSNFAIIILYFLSFFEMPIFTYFWRPVFK